jgi:hypothetical protein
MYKEDIITKLALKIIEEAGEVLETKEIEERVILSIKDITRTKLFARLNNLRGGGLIRGKFVGPGKGVWIWWKKDAFSKNKNSGKKLKMDNIGWRL